MQTSHIEPAGDKSPAVSVCALLYPMVDRAVAAVTAQASLTAMVVALMPLLRTLGLAILRQVIQQRDLILDRQRPVLLCPLCKSPLRRTRHLRTVWRYTLLGSLSYDRRNWKCPSDSCKHSAYPADWGLGLLERLHGHSQEFASMVVLLTTLMPNAKAMDLFNKCFGFTVSTTLARGLTMAIGTQLYESEKVAAE